MLVISLFFLCFLSLGWEEFDTDVALGVDLGVDLGVVLLSRSRSRVVPDPFPKGHTEFLPEQRIHRTVWNNSFLRDRKLHRGPGQQFLMLMGTSCLLNSHKLTTLDLTKVKYQSKSSQLSIYKAERMG